MRDQRPVRLSKLMSMILRHDPVSYGVTVDAEGFTSIRELLGALRKHIPDTTEEEIRAIVKQVDPEKQRFSIEGPDIRANYGHSLKEKIQYEAAEPPEILFHGTALNVLEAIQKDGLKPMGRQYVHLTPRRDLAIKVGGRHGKPVLLRVDALRAWQDGIIFYRANPSFWLVDSLPPKYLARE